MTQDDGRRLAQIVRGLESATEDWLDAQRLEETRRHARRPQLFHSVVEPDEQPAAAVRGQIFKRAGLLSPVAKIGRSHAPQSTARCRIDGEDSDQAVGLRERYWPEQHRIDDAEDRRVGSDSAPEGKHADRYKRRRPPKLAERISNVGPDAVREIDPPLVATAFDHGTRRSEPELRLPSRFVHAHAARDVPADHHLEVKVHFASKLPIHPVPEHERPNSQPQVRPFHVRPSSRRDRSPLSFDPTDSTRSPTVSGRTA